MRERLLQRFEGGVFPLQLPCLDVQRVQLLCHLLGPLIERLRAPIPGGLLFHFRLCVRNRRLEDASALIE